MSIRSVAVRVESIRLEESVSTYTRFTKILHKWKCKTFILGPTIVIHRCGSIVSILKCIIEVSN